jgi:hypothetical protein
MYACNLEIGRGFFEGCADRGIGHVLFATHPYPRKSRIDSEKRALSATLVRVYAGSCKRPTEKPFLGTSVHKPAARHYNCGKCFVVIFGHSRSVEGVGS